MQSSYSREKNTCADTKTAAHYDVSCPVRTFTEGEDDFKIQESGKNRSERTFRYHGKEFRLVTGFYPNGWPVLSLESPDNGELYTVTYRQSGRLSGIRDSPTRHSLT